MSLFWPRGRQKPKCFPSFSISVHRCFCRKVFFSVELAALYSVSKGHYSKWISALLHFPPKRGRERWATYYACCCTPCLSSTALAITRRQLRDVFLSPHFFGNWKIGKLRKSHGCLGKQRTANYSWFTITVFILVWWCTSSSWQQESETAKIGGGRAHNEVIVNTSQSTKRRFGLLEKNLKRRKERCKQKKSKEAETKLKTTEEKKRKKSIVGLKRWNRSHFLAFVRGSTLLWPEEKCLGALSIISWSKGILLFLYLCARKKNERENGLKWMSRLRCIIMRERMTDPRIIPSHTFVLFLFSGC